MSNRELCSLITQTRPELIFVDSLQNLLYRLYYTIYLRLHKKFLASLQKPDLKRQVVAGVE